MKDQDRGPSCLVVFLFWGVFLGGIALAQNFSIDVDKKVPTPVPTRIPTPTWAGPSPEDCRRETDEEWANLCLEAIEEHYTDMQQSSDYEYEGTDYGDPEYYDPFEDGRFVDGP